MVWVNRLAVYVASDLCSQKTYIDYETIKTLLNSSKLRCSFMAFGRMVSIFGRFFMPKVKDLMTKSIATLDVKAPLKDTFQALTEDNIRSLVMMEEDKPVGILTRRDIIRLCLLKKVDAEETTVGEVMSHPLITIDSNENIFKAYEKMVQSNIGKLIILEQGKPVGRIRLDEIRHLAVQAPGTNIYRVGYFLLGVLITIAVTLIIVAL